jgi:Mn2+/Fe2+ NRAMP family transporter
MTHIEKRNLSIFLIGSVLILAGFFVAVSDIIGAGVGLSFVGSVTMLIGAVLMWLESRRQRRRN